MAAYLRTQNVVELTHSLGVVELTHSLGVVELTHSLGVVELTHSLGVVELTHSLGVVELTHWVLQCVIHECKLINVELGFSKLTEFTSLIPSLVHGYTAVPKHDQLNNFL